MKQSASKANTSLGRRPARLTLGQSRRNLLAGGACAVALLAPLEGQADWQRTTRYDADGKTVTFRKIKPLNFAISELDAPAPANDCPGRAFEIANPRAGEARCVGYIARRR
jgi:hypothetical protein